jgi:hypothetical protein
MSTSVLQAWTRLTMKHFTGIALQPLFITEYSETAAHFNGNFDTDNQIYVP